MQPQVINTAPGPEDMLLDTSGTPRLIISCGDFFNIRNANRKGALYYYNIQDNIAGTFNLVGLPPNTEFFPHGIAMHPKEPKLYAIVHDRDSRHSSVVIFNVKGNDLEFIEEIRNEKFISASANDLTVSDEGNIYITNSGSFKPLSLIPRAIFIRPFISCYHPKTKKFKKARHTWFGNGIHAIGTKLYYVDAIWKRIREMDIQEDGSLKLNHKIKVARNLDNISYHEGKLYIPSHNNLKKLAKAKSDHSVKPPFSVHEVDLKTRSSKCIYTSKDGKPISAVSTALRYGDQLYLSQIFDDFIIKLKYPNNGGQN